MIAMLRRGWASCDGGMDSISRDCLLLFDMAATVSITTVTPFTNTVPTFTLSL